MSSERLLPVSVVSKRLGNHISTVYRLIESGDLPAVRTGTKKGYRVKSGDLDQYINEKKVLVL